MSAFIRYVGHHIGLFTIGLLALLIALGGTSYAAATLAANSVGSKQIKKDAVTSSEIKKNAVTSSKVKNGSLQKGDFAANQLPAGPQGPQGPQGPAGPAATVGVVALTGPIQSVPPGGNTLNMRATCPAGTVVVGTGINTGIGNADFVLSFGTFVGGFVHNDTSITIQASVQAICASGVGNGGIGTAQ